MGLWDKLRGELIDIIECTDMASGQLVHRFDRLNNEIKYGAKLTVREGQTAVFVNEGKLADVFVPGMYELQTSNLPILATLKGWKYGFESPFKAEVYFISTLRQTNQKWGTKNPIQIRDPEYGPVRIRAFGTYEFKISDSSAFVRGVTGTDGSYTAEEISEQLRNIVVSRFSDATAESKIPVLDMAANYDELGSTILDRIQSEMGEYGIELTKLLVENISLPETLQEALDKRASMNMVGNLNDYTKYQTANAIEDAATNDGGGSGMMGAGLGAGLGMGMANQMANAVNSNMSSQGSGEAMVPPPLPGGTQYFVAVNGQQTGPFAVTVLQQQIASGQLTGQTMVWCQGMSAWAPASQVAELAGFFSTTPPPIPPAI